MTTRCLFTCLLLLLWSVSGRAKPLVAAPRVDQRVELLSLVFRLAGNPEYSSTQNQAYVERIQHHFAPFQQHPLLAYVQQLRDSSGIGYDAVMAMAITLAPPPRLTPLVPFDKATPDKRWTAPAAAKFVRLLQQFYQETACQAFFRENAAYYALAAQRFGVLFRQFDVAWYRSYYGSAPQEQFSICIGLGNGSSNYGPHLTLPGRATKAYAIIGSWTFDAQGLPVYTDARYLPVLVHEFNHSFVNSLTEHYATALAPAGQRIYAQQRAKMRRQAYGDWQTMLSESLVRACVLRYLYQHPTRDSLAVTRDLREQLGRGFSWMADLVQLLGTYEQQRAHYPTLERFMPELVRFYDQVPSRLAAYESAYQQRCARVVAVSPFSDQATLVSPGVHEIRFTFDRRLEPTYSFGPTDVGLAHYPKVKSAETTFADAQRTVVLQVELQANTNYQMRVNGGMMQASDGYRVQPYILTFTTGEKLRWSGEIGEIWVITSQLHGKSLCHKTAAL